MDQSAQRRVPIKPQRVDAPLTSSAVLLTLALTDVSAGSDSVATVRGVLADLEDITKNVAFRDLDAALACTIGIGSAVWDVVTGAPRPAELHPFREVVGAVHTAPSTPGDLLVHIRANRRDLCFELERQLLDRLHGAVTVVDETIGFRYFDARDLLGFVDGTESPSGEEAWQTVTITGDEPFDGGSYLITQRYLHDLTSWNALTVEQQDTAIDRHKLDDIEIPDAKKASNSHVALNSINAPDGTQLTIVRENMPFGTVGETYGTCVIGYASDPAVTERMLHNMFIGDPVGNHDRILDFSTAVTGSLFYIPTVDFLDVPTLP